MWQDYFHYSNHFVFSSRLPLFNVSSTEVSSADSLTPLVTASTLTIAGLAALAAFMVSDRSRRGETCLWLLAAVLALVLMTPASRRTYSRWEFRASPAALDSAAGSWIAYRIASKCVSLCRESKKK